MTRGEGRTRGRGHTQGTFSSMLSWLSRLAVSKACRSDSISRLAASPKSLILFTFTARKTERPREQVSKTARVQILAHPQRRELASHLVQFHPVQSRNILSACPLQAMSLFFSFCPFESAGWDHQGSPQASHPELLALKRLKTRQITEEAVSKLRSSPRCSLSEKALTRHRGLPVSMSSGTSTGGTGVPGRSVSMGSAGGVGSGEEGLAELGSVLVFPSKGLGC